MKKINFIGEFLFITLLVFFTTGCGGGGGGSSTPPIDYKSKVHALDLSGAQGIYITGESTKSGIATALDKKVSSQNIEATAAAVDLDPNSVYKITNDGKLERVAIEDEEGKELPRASVKPVVIKDLNSLYLILWLAIADSNAPNGAVNIPYLVHKSTGFAYNASQIYNANGVQWDKNNNFYVQHRSSSNENYDTIYKIDTSTLGDSTLTVTEIPSAYSFENAQWMVDKTGEFIVFGGGGKSGAINGDPVRYLSISTGAIHNINEDIPNTFDQNFILGLDDKVYAYSMDYSCGTTTEQCTTWYNISYDSNKLPVITEMAKTNAQPRGWARTRKVIGGKLIYIADDTSSFVIQEIDPINGTVFHHDESFNNEFSDVIDYVVSNNDVYVFGTFKDTGANGFYKYNVVSRSGKRISVDSAYDIQKYTVLAAGNFLVEGIRLSDQAHFYGTLAEDGSITVTSTVAIGAPTVLYMEAIRPADFMLIDGSPDDWSTSLRTLNDVSGDANSSEADLLHYSQTTTATQYFGMLEYEPGLDQSYYLRVSFEGNETLQFHDNNVSFLPDTSLTDAGGIVAKGSVIEFSIPLTTVTTPNVVSVAVFAPTASGDINTSNPIDTMSN